MADLIGHECYKMERHASILPRRADSSGGVSQLHPFIFRRCCHLRPRRRSFLLFKEGKILL